MEDADGLIHFTRRAEHQLDMLSLDGGGSLHTSNLLSQSVPPKSKTHVVDENNISSYGQAVRREYHNLDTIAKQDKLTSSELLHQMQQQHDSSSVDTELEVSINNAHLLTNLAKAVQEKERNDLNKLSDQKK